MQVKTAPLVTESEGDLDAVVVGVGDGDLVVGSGGDVQRVVELVVARSLRAEPRHTRVLAAVHAHLTHRPAPRHSVAPPGGGEASPLWVDVQKLCNMRVLS